ncbi:Thymocyte nuclear protein 1 [Irineochytrium annulatum]|nr:Thymocyte nuclear protein 1 [Irineochytrium annulatum]
MKRKAASATRRSKRGKAEKDDVDEDEQAEEVEDQEEETAAPAKRRPKRAAKRAKIEKDGDDDDAYETTENVEEDGERFFLMKAEPDSRIIKGIDVKFSIDDLEEIKVSPWDGVRNHTAKNIMRDRMRVGDQVLFYASNTKVPGITGLCKVAKPAYVDHTAFDTKHPYYDAKSDKTNPRWFMVDVEFVKKFPRIISLKELQGYKDKELKNMTLLRQGRLSVQPVKKAEFEFILGLLDAEGAEE